MPLGSGKFSMRCFGKLQLLRRRYRCEFFWLTIDFGFTDPARRQQILIFSRISATLRGPPALNLPPFAIAPTLGEHRNSIGPTRMEATLPCASSTITVGNSPTPNTEERNLANHVRQGVPLSRRPIARVIVARLPQLVQCRWQITRLSVVVRVDALFGKCLSRSFAHRMMRVPQKCRDFHLQCVIDLLTIRQHDSNGEIGFPSNRVSLSLVGG